MKSFAVPDDQLAVGEDHLAGELALPGNLAGLRIQADRGAANFKQELLIKTVDVTLMENERVSPVIDVLVLPTNRGLVCDIDFNAKGLSEGVPARIAEDHRVSVDHRRGSDGDISEAFFRIHENVFFRYLKLPDR